MMKLSEILPQLHSPKGASSLIAGVMSGDFSPIRDQDAIGTSMADAIQRRDAAVAAQASAKSDWAYWGYAGDVAFWRCVVCLLEAAEICGPDHLPDIEMPKTSGAVMDVQYDLERFGEKVLAAAKSP